MRIVDDVKYDFQDLLLVPKRSDIKSRSEIDVTRTFKFKYSCNKYYGSPLLVSNMDHTGTVEMADKLCPYQVGVALHKFYTVEQLIQYFSRTDRNIHTFYTMGIAEEDEIKFKTVMQSLDHDTRKHMYVCVDVANGYSSRFVNFISKIRENNPDITILAGNVVTPDMVYDLIEAGADIVKLGLGSGSCCTTRKLTGVGYAQASTCVEGADAAHGLGGLICSDGGIICPGDIVKAYGLGADFIMAGSLFSGHEECDGELINVELHDSISRQITDAIENWIRQKDQIYQKIILPDGTPYILEFDSTQQIPLWHINKLPLSCYENPERLKMRFYGMSSTEAMNKHYGGKADYRASEGKVVEIPFKGSVKNTIEEILGGLRSGCAYIGARSLKDLSKCATFTKVNRQLNSSLDKYNV